jgi:tetratricopeptide (TPR) repeat protein
MPARRPICIPRTLRLPVLLLLAGLLWFAGRHGYLYISTTPATWQAILIAGDAAMTTKQYRAAQRHYLRALDRARVRWPGTVHEAEALCKLANAFNTEAWHVYGGSDVRFSIRADLYQAQADFKTAPRDAAIRFINCRFVDRRLDWAEDYWRRAIAIYEAQPDAPSRIAAVRSLFDLALLVQYNPRRQSQALEHLKQMLALLEAGYRPRDLAFATRVSNLREEFYLRKYPELQERCALQALAIARTCALGPALGGFYEKLRWFYTDQGDYRRALAYARKWFTCETSVISPRDLRYAQSLQWLARAYMDCREYLQAESLYRQALRISRAYGAAGSEVYFWTHVELCNCYDAAGKLREEEAQIRRWIADTRRWYFHGNRYRLRALSRYCDFLFTQGRTTEQKAVEAQMKAE